MELTSRTLFFWDRNTNSGKRKGGGLCIYVHNSWCTNAQITDAHCSPDLEYLTIKCRPFYLPREFSAVMVTAVYIPPDDNANTALGILHGTISKQQSKYPDAAHILTGDFNHADLKLVLPKFTQHIKCATRGAKTLDKAYSNISKGFRSTPLPHLGHSDHLSILLTPAYTSLRRKTQVTSKIVKTWPEGASSQLQDCFKRTNWDIFENEHLEAFTTTVLSYINTCTDNVTVSKQVWMFPNQKPWCTGVVRTLLKLYSTARASLKKGIRDAKAAHKRRIEDHFNNNNPRRAWQGIQQITNYRGNRSTATDGDTSLAEQLNCFFARFEVSTTNVGDITPSPVCNNSHTLTVQEHEVRRMLSGVNPRKAAGPDGVTGRVLKVCASQLSAISQDSSTCPCPKPSFCHAERHQICYNNSPTQKNYHKQLK